MEPFSLAALSGFLGATKTSVDIASSTYGLLEKVRGGKEEQAAIDEQLLRLALLAVDRNLVVLDAINLRVEREHRAKLFAVAAALEVSPLAALVVNWPVPDAEAELPRNASQKDFDAWTSEVSEREDDEQLLAHARYIVARATGLCALAGIDPAACKDLRLGQRLGNLRAAHVRVRQLLRNQDTLGHLLQRRREPPAAPPAPFPG